MLTAAEHELPDGRTLQVYDTGSDTGGDSGGLAVFWLHGTPNTGEPPEPLFAAAAERGIRWVSYDRPAYGTSTRRPGRDVASAADDLAGAADALGLDRFAVLGHSGGAPHALAGATLLPDRVLAVVCISGLAPLDADGPDWFAGLTDSGIAQHRAAITGRAELEQYLASSEFDPEQFTPADHAALSGDWAWLGGVAGKAVEQGLAGMVDDLLAQVAPWGFDPAQVRGPVLFVHGEQDRMVPSTHSQWLAGQCRSAESWRLPDDGHVSVLHAGPAALDWIVQHAR